MKPLPKRASPLMIRTDFENREAWEAICDLVRSPAHIGDDVFHAHVEFIDERDYCGLSVEELVEGIQKPYVHSFFFVVDETAVANPEFPILVVALGKPRVRTFRAIPSQIQGVENNLSTANMDFEEFADSVDEDGIFRGFSKA
jgi:hypothetical protein